MTATIWIGIIGILAVMSMAVIGVGSVSASEDPTLQLTVQDSRTIRAEYNQSAQHVGVSVKLHQYRIRYAQTEGASPKYNPWNYGLGLWEVPGGGVIYSYITFTGLIPNTVYEIQARSYSEDAGWFEWTVLKYIRTMYKFQLFR